jgi:hypothetical protein
MWDVDQTLSVDPTLVFVTCGRVFAGNMIVIRNLWRTES